MSSQTALPAIVAPASSSRRTMVASRLGTKPSTVRDPFIIGTPATAVLSLTATVRPASGPVRALGDVGGDVPGAERVVRIVRRPPVPLRRLRSAFGVQLLDGVPVLQHPGDVAGVVGQFVGVHSEAVVLGQPGEFLGVRRGQGHGNLPGSRPRRVRGWAAMRGTLRPPRYGSVAAVLLPRPPARPVGRRQRLSAGVSAACASCQRPGRRSDQTTTNEKWGTAMNSDFAIEAEGLTKRFGSTQALAGIDLAARHGTVLGVLGPNGAGKTTAVRILATLLARRRRRPDRRRRRAAGPGARPPQHRPDRAVRLGRRGPDRHPEPGADRPAARPVRRRGASPGRASCSPGST